MKKAITCLLFMGLALAVMTSGAWAAGTIKVFANNNASGAQASYLLANEGYKTTAPAQAGTTAATATKQMYLIMTAGVAGPTSVSVGLTNATMDNADGGNKYVLALWTDAGTAGVIEAGELKLVVDNKGSVPVVGNLVSGKLTFSASVMKADADGADGAEVAIGAADKLVIVMVNTTTDTAANIATEIAGTSGATAAVDGASGKVAFRFTPSTGLTSSSTITASLWVGTGSTAEGSVTFASFMNEYVAAVTTLGTKTIDVAKSRKEFTDGKVCTLVVSAADRDKVNTVAAYKDTVSYVDTYFLSTQDETGGSTDKTTFTLYGSNQAITSVKDGAATPNTLTYNSTTGSWTQESVADVVKGGTANATFTITVDGTTVIDARSFTASVVTSPATGYSAITYLDKGAAGTWSLNAYQATTPYMFAGSDGTYDTFVKFSNTSTSAGNVFVDVTLDNGTKYSNIQLSKTNCAGLSTTGIDAGTVGTIWASEIATAAGFSADQAFAAVFTVTVTKGSVTGVCFYKRENGDRQMPLFTGAITAAAGSDGNLMQ